VPGNADTVIIQSGHTVTLDTTRYAYHLYNYGTLNMSANSFDLGGNYYSYGGQVSGGGTFNVSGGAGIDICAGNSQANFGGVGVNLVPAGSGTVNCTWGMDAAGLWVPQGTLVLGANSTFGWIIVYANGMLDLGTTTSTAGSITNSGTVRATRNSPGASSTYFGLAGGPNDGFVVQPLTGGFSQLILDWHGSDHAFKTGTSVNSGVGWGEYWILSVTGSDTARVTIPTRLFTPGANSKVCYHVASTTWNCAMTSYDAVSTPNTVTRNPVSISTNLAFAAGNVGPTAVTVRDLSATPKPIEMSPVLSALAALLGVGGLIITARYSLSHKRVSD